MPSSKIYLLCFFLYCVIKAKLLWMKLFWKYHQFYLKHPEFSIFYQLHSIQQWFHHQLCLVCLQQSFLLYTSACVQPLYKFGKIVCSYIYRIVLNSFISKLREKKPRTMVIKKSVVTAPKLHFALLFFQLTFTVVNFFFIWITQNAPLKKK